MIRKQQLIGSYRLISWKNFNKLGEHHFPLGKDAKGYIHYSSDDFVFVNIVPTIHSNFQRQSTSNPTTSNLKHLFYCGKYEIYDEYLIHNIELCSLPGWADTSQKRGYKIVNDNLILTAEGLLGVNEEITAELSWKPI